MTIPNKHRHNTMAESPQYWTSVTELKRLSGPLLTSLIIIVAAVIAVEEFGVSAEWASILAGAGIALSGLWLV
jgi:hypothetical protein